MSTVITSVDHRSPAQRAGVRPGEKLLTINGHDLDAIESAIAAFHAENEKPTCIILDTLKGKGVSFMENSVDWHGKGPNDEEYAQAMQELNAAYAALEEEDK